MSKKYAVIIGNMVDGIAIADTPLDTGHPWIDVTELNPLPGPGWTYIDGVFSLPVQSPPAPKVYTRLELINVLGSDYNAIVTASKTDVDVEVWLERFRLQESFNVLDNNFISDVNFLATKTLITQEKANTILS